MISRLVSLYRDGGVGELARGARDYLFHSPLAPVLSSLYSTRTLRINGVSVAFVVRNEEALRRSIGHGETAVIADFLANLSPADTVWDVGANQGTYSLFAAAVGADTHAFEPGPDACRTILENGKANGSTLTLHKVALGAEKGTLVLREADRSGVRWLAEGGPGDEVTVVRGDDLQLPKPDVLKVDVEGAEVAVLEGMREALRHCRRCYVEAHGDSADEVRELLGEAGFETEFVLSLGQTMVLGTKPTDRL